MFRDDFAVEGPARLAVVLRDVAAGAPAGSGGGLSDIAFALRIGERALVAGDDVAACHLLLRLVAGTVRGYRGMALVLGREIAADREPPRRHRRKVGLLAAEPALLPGLSVRRNVLLGRLGHAGILPVLTGRFPVRDRLAAEVAMDEAGIAPHAEERAGTLAPELRHRVALARLLAQNPQLVLAEEPAPGAIAGPVLHRLLAAIAERRGITLVAASGTPAASGCFDRLVVLDGGRIAWSGPPDEPGGSELSAAGQQRHGAHPAHLRLVV
jgi:phosphonate transport system ATP-binding protein